MNSSRITFVRCARRQLASSEAATSRCSIAGSSIEGPAPEESRPGLSADHFAVDSANTLIFCRTTEDVAEFKLIGSSKFSVGPMAASDIGDSFFVALLKSKVVMITKCDDR
jgi:hypothetical protein